MGQDLYEEVDLQSAASQGGENYGWHIWEGFHCYNPSTGCTPPLRYSPPITEYTHDLGCAIQGGYVYRSPMFMLPRGIYFYGDHCSGRIWGLRFNGSTWDGAELSNAGDGLSSFGEDEAGNLYVANIDSGIVSRIDSVESQLWLPSIVR